MNMGSVGDADPPRGRRNPSASRSGKAEMRLSRMPPKGDTEKIGRWADGELNTEGITPMMKRREDGNFISLDTESELIGGWVLFALE